MNKKIKCPKCDRSENVVKLNKGYRCAFCGNRFHSTESKQQELNFNVNKWENRNIYNNTYITLHMEDANKPIVKGKQTTLYLNTYKKIKEFLKEQEEFIYKSEIYYKLGVSNNSINAAIAELKNEGILEINDAGQIKIKREW